MSGLMSGLGLGVNWRRRLPLLSIVAGSQRLAVAQRVGRCGEGRRGGFKCYLWLCRPCLGMISWCCIALDTRSAQRRAVTHQWHIKGHVHLKICKRAVSCHCTIITTHTCLYSQTAEYFMHTYIRTYVLWTYKCFVVLTDGVRMLLRTLPRTVGSFSVVT